jgi:hypothetical protein
VVSPQGEAELTAPDHLLHLPRHALIEVQHCTCVPHT